MNALERHGFIGIELDADFSNLCDVLPTTTDIACLGTPQMIQGMPWRFLDRSLTRDDIFVGWNIKDLYDVGAYGKIFKGYRILVKRIPGKTIGEPDKFIMVSSAAQEVVLKQSLPLSLSDTSCSIMTPADVKAHISESLLHVLAWNILQNTPLPWAVPRPYEMFGDYDTTLNGWKSMTLCMDFVKGRTLHFLLEKTWSITTPSLNALSFLEILAQMSCILFILQRYLRLNHRDVKVNNILVRQRKPSEPLILQLGGKQFQTNLELTLIDFGFACVGCPPPRPPMSAFHASTYFTSHEMCCKVGRDLAQLIFCIHCYFPLHKFLPSDLFREVFNWMKIPWKDGFVNILNGFDTTGMPTYFIKESLQEKANENEATTPPASLSRPSPPSHSLIIIPEYNQGIYEFLRRAEVDVPKCEPSLLFKRCCELKTRYR